MEEITTENFRETDLRSLALNEDWGRLVFKKAYPILESTRDLFNELEDLGYQEQLTQKEIESIEHSKRNFIDRLNRLREFDIGQANPEETHNNLEQDIINFAEGLERNFREPLLWLRQEAARQSEDVKSLEDKQKAAVQAEKEYKKLSQKMEEELRSLQAQKGEVATAHGEVAAAKLGKYFESQADQYTQEVKNWLGSRNSYLKWLVGIVSANLIAYIFLFVTDKIGWWPRLDPEDFFTIPYGVAKFALLILLSYGLAFSSRNYSISSNLKAANLHRKNVAETLEDLLSTEFEPQDRSQLVQQAAEAMFKQLPTGFVARAMTSDSGPVQAVVAKISPDSKTD
ncbi:MAG: hypothetical protein WD000_00360 [Thermodesulfobacteriota bacterium]